MMLQEASVGPAERATAAIAALKIWDRLGKLLPVQSKGKRTVKGFSLRANSSCIVSYRRAISWLEHRRQQNQQ